MAGGIFVISPCRYRWRALAFSKNSTIVSSMARPSTSLLVGRASKQPPQEPDDKLNNNNNKSSSSNAFSSPDDLNYLWKLVAGSVGGAAVIKYGSVIFPDITKPNILQALVMIMVPVFISVIVLMKEGSMTDNQDPF